MATGHGGRDRMAAEINKKYANITQSALGIYKSMCLTCQKKKKRPKKMAVHSLRLDL
ncbi:hypothetical protein ACOMHN_005747 [Nucella lapillus]